MMEPVEKSRRSGEAFHFFLGGFMAETYVFYPCDPEKNVLCGKTHCALLADKGDRKGVPERTCRHTTHSEFAADGGAPVCVVLE